MADGDVYKIIELVGTSKTSWEEAVKTVVDRATKSLRDLRIAEVKELDVRRRMERSRSTGPRSGSPSSTKVKTRF